MPALNRRVAVIATGRMMPYFKRPLALTSLLIAGWIAGLFLFSGVAGADDTGYNWPTASSGGDSGCCPRTAAYSDDNIQSLTTVIEAASFMSVDVNTPGGCSLHSSVPTFYSGFGLPVPAGAVIAGVEVLLDDAYVSHAREPLSPAFWRVDLSWNNGVNWTTANDTGNLPEWSRFSSSSIDYTLGNASDAWGHTWTLTQLGDASFRLRILGCTEAALIVNSS